jgi:hypothetical protein
MRIFLDDIRSPKVEKFDRICRTPREFMEIIRDCLDKGETISYISFDHDLGVDPETGDLYSSGLELAQALCLRDHGLLSEDFTYNVHSSNPVGAENIRAYMDNYLKRRGIRYD